MDESGFVGVKNPRGFDDRFDDGGVVVDDEELKFGHKPQFHHMYLWAEHRSSIILTDSFRTAKPSPSSLQICGTCEPSLMTSYWKKRLKVVKPCATSTSTEVLEKPFVIPWHPGCSQRL